MEIGNARRMTRRAMLKVGALGAGLTLDRYLRLASAGEVAGNAPRSAILVFLNGGPSHQDTFDMKPQAPEEYRGAFRPVATNVPGIEICEHLPRLARLADRYAIVRGIGHNLADHGIGSRYLMTGNRPLPALRYPEYGSVVGKEFPSAPDLPSFVSIDRQIEGPGYLGPEFGPLCTGEKPRYGRPFNVRGITLGDSLTVAKYESRQRLLADLDTAFRGYEELDDPVRGIDRFSRQAYRIISSRRTREAFDLSRETPETVERFGKHEFGQSLLLASRLVAAGVRFVTVLLDGWDTHNNNFDRLKRTLLPSFDQAFGALVETLGEHGRLGSTALLATGEFGRTPKVNERAGRDHWARAMFALMAGGDVRGGQALGATTDKAEEPLGAGFTPEDLGASFYRNLGIDPRKEYHSNVGRPIRLVRNGTVIDKLFS